MNYDKKFRHEYKYLISDLQVELLRSRISGIMLKDSHTKDGIYNIRSLYFDDYYDRCFYENENGTDPREKFRIRIYNQSDDFISLECKRKERGKTLKTSCRITRDECEALMRGEYPRCDGDTPAVKRKLSLAMMQNAMRPKVIVEYDRIPYIYKYGNVRVTFDLNISSSDDISAFLSGDVPKRPVMPAGMQLLEVKFDEFLPDFIYRALALESLSQTAYSKYYLCRKYKY